MRKFRAWLAAAVAIASVVTVAPLPAPRVGAAAAIPIKVVLLGDSYAAGNGARNASGDRNYEGPKDCYRSPTNWASQYVDGLEAQGYAVTFVNRACSGGVISDITSPRKMDDKFVYVASGLTAAQAEAEALGDQCKSRYPGDEYYTAEYQYEDPLNALGVVKCTRYMAPQIDAVGADTDLVLMTGGGNDVRFAEIVKQCFAPGYRDPGDCRRDVESARTKLDDVRLDLIDTLATIRGRIPSDARVALVGYPFLANNDDFELVYRRLGVFESDRYAAAKEVRNLGRTGDEKQSAAVDAANAAAGTNFATFVNIKALFTGHEPKPELGTGNPDRWISEIENRIIIENYHYNARGHQELGNHLLGYGTFGAVPDITFSSDIDLVFVIDTTGSMGGDISAVMASAQATLDQLEAGSSSFRVAIVDYRDFPDRTGASYDYASNLVLGFSSDPTTISTAIDSLTLGYGGDTPETMWSGIMRALQLDWRPGVKKIILQFGDAPALDPEPYTGYTTSDIIAESLLVDPVAVNAVDTGFEGQEIRDVADATGGVVLTAPSSSQVAAQIAEIIANTVSAPYAWVGSSYATRLGVPVTFHAEGSYDPDGTIVQYEWDVNGDGVYDAATATPTYAHTYAADYQGLVGLRVTDDSGQIALATAPVDASVDADGIPATIDNCPTDHNPGQDDADADGIGDVCDPSFTVVEVDSLSVGFSSGPGFVGVVPARLLETRDGLSTVDGQFNAIGIRASGQVTELTVAGRGGVPGDASAAVLNLAVTGGTEPGYATVYACGSERPTAANLNFAAGQTISNSVTSKIGTAGAVCIYTYGSTHVVADVNGYYPVGSKYTGVVPARLLETRDGLSTVDGQFNAIGIRASGQVTELTVAGRGGVPGDASAAVLNLAVTGGTEPGYATVYACGSERPTAANLNFAAGQTISNSVTSGVGPGGTVCIYTYGTTHVVADVNGYFPAASGFTGIVPARLLETRDGLSTVDGDFNAVGIRASGRVTELTVAGRGGVPAIASSVVLNLAVTGGAEPGYATVYACGSERPTAANLNFAAGQTISNSVTSGVGPGGTVCIYTYGTTHVIVDANGYHV